MLFILKPEAEQPKIIASPMALFKDQGFRTCPPFNTFILRHLLH